MYSLIRNAVRTLCIAVPRVDHFVRMKGKYEFLVKVMESRSADLVLDDPSSMLDSRDETTVLKIKN
jgi:hypothetical protein